ncbi:hypothetical protein AB0454_42725 [Streptomyces sp. NPDC093509]|uniref:hypothetical protein n=1 Tax=Streptomyces sp. NPDC093509 TaxID=3154982 RepID=UPI003450AD1F
MALLFGCALGEGGYAGFCLGGLWGFHAGAAAAASVLLVVARLSFQLCELQRKEVVDCFVRAKATSEAALAAVTLYQAAVFPLTSKG